MPPVGIEPTHTRHFSSTTPQGGASLPRALPTELQELSSPLFNVLDQRTNTACGIRTHEAYGQQVNTKGFLWWPSPHETLNLDTQDRDPDPLGEQFSFDHSDNAA
jgi:hypothetical protein